MLVDCSRAFTGGHSVSPNRGWAFTRSDAAHADYGCELVDNSAQTDCSRAFTGGSTALADHSRAFTGGRTALADRDRKP